MAGDKLVTEDRESLVHGVEFAIRSQPTSPLRDRFTHWIKGLSSASTQTDVPLLIRFLSEQPEKTPPSLSELIRVLHSNTSVVEEPHDFLINFVEEGEEIKTPSEETLRVITKDDIRYAQQYLLEHPDRTEETLGLMTYSAENNRDAARQFTGRLRAGARDLFERMKDEAFIGGEATVGDGLRDRIGVDFQLAWFDARELQALADHWQLPIVFLKNSSNPNRPGANPEIAFEHWLLCLSAPEQVNGQWKVIVYDPMKGRERFFDLDGYRADFTDMSDFFRYNITHGLYCNPAGLQELKDGVYSYELLKDRDIARQASLMEAKQVRTQFNGRDCGPMVLFMAMIRAGMKDDKGGFNTFKFSGREQLERDLGVRIDTREKILGKDSA